MTDTTAGEGVNVQYEADLLLDNIACATQNRALLRGDPAEDKVLTEAVLENGKQAISRAITKALAAPAQSRTGPFLYHIESVTTPGECWEIVQGRQPTEYEDDPAFVITPLYTRAAQPSAGAQVARWECRVYGIDARPGPWELSDGPDDGQTLRPCRTIEYRPLYTTPAQPDTSAIDDVRKLKLAICGGEDVPGAIEAVSVDDCVGFIRDERLNRPDIAQPDTGDFYEAASHIHDLCRLFNPEIHDIDDTLSEINQIVLPMCSRPSAPGHTDLMVSPEAIDAFLATGDHPEIQPDQSTGWVVSDANRTKWRTWKDGCSAWTDDRDAATRYARREDAEAVHRDDEDAWSITPYGKPDHVHTFEVHDKSGIALCTDPTCRQMERKPKPDTGDVAALREALEPLARLEVPFKSVGNAGAYSILHSDIRRAQQALAATSPGGK